MEEEQAFKRSRNTDEMVELRILLQSKVIILFLKIWKWFLLPWKLSAGLALLEDFKALEVEEYERFVWLHKDL